ncbi:MAG: hypothetical protein HOW73_06325 [Polyangiaceae bacterium]|nr:hypothetical protein [Polyangiaceae bacterium]
MPMSPEAQALLKAARKHPDRPSDEARTRMRRNVMRAVSAGAGAVGATTAGTAAAQTLFAKIAGGALVVAALGGVVVGGRALFSSSESSVDPKNAPASTSTSTTVVGTSRETSEALGSTSTAANLDPTSDRVVASSALRTTATPSASSVASSPRIATAPSKPAEANITSDAASAPAVESVDVLKEEAALLASAQSALGKGQAARALELTNEHETRFPKGALSFERRAVHAMALCALGRGTEGRREAQAIVDRAPGTPLAERVSAACP